MQRFPWQTVRDRPDRAPLPIRSVLRPRQTIPLHDHDYAEVSWIEAGTGRDQDGRGTHALSPGMILLHRPDDPHALQAGSQGLVIVNIVLAVAEVDRVLERWQLPSATWGGHHRICGQDQALLEASAVALVADPGDAMRREAMVLVTVSALRRQQPERFANCPPWLADACQRMEHPEHFLAGIPRLVAFCGRSREHVARELRRHAGVSPRQVVSQARLRHAAALLITSERQTTDIALSCGWSTVAGFYAAFRAHFGCPPQRWRQQATRVPTALLSRAASRSISAVQPAAASLGW